MREVFDKYVIGYVVKMRCLDSVCGYRGQGGFVGREIMSEADARAVADEVKFRKGCGRKVVRVVKYVSRGWAIEACESNSPWSGHGSYMRIPGGWASGEPEEAKRCDTYDEARELRKTNPHQATVKVVPHPTARAVHSSWKHVGTVER